MANQSLTIYLSRELADRVEAAKAEGTIDPKTVVKAALERHLDGRSDELGEVLAPQVKTLSELLGQPEVMALWRDQEGSAIEIACGIIARTAYPLRPVPEPEPEHARKVAYELWWADGEQQLQSRLDALTDAGGWPVSIAFNSQNRICMLVGWNADER